jgi:ATP-dependent helicase Lhr and Lhr-like helicase
MVMSSSSPSSAFELLDPRVQRWIWKEGWSELRDIQEEAIPAILDGDQDVILASATASGKTEAAFLPIASAVANEDSGLSVLYLSPLKALINDQHRRLEAFFEAIDLPVHRWHGDVPSGRKRRVLQKPQGVLLITPESLEALLIRNGPKARTGFSTLRFIVVDELHAFIGTERGRQVQSLMHRLDLMAQRHVPRIALSATLGDMRIAGEFLRPGAGEAVQQIISHGSRQDVRLQIRGYRVTPPRLNERAVREAERKGREVTPEDVVSGDSIDISRDIFHRLRGGRHIVFTNRRADVELYTDLLRRLCERQKLPVEFWPHHGSLDKSLREDAEAALRAADRPATIIATSTLELGIDVGSVESIAQIGPPNSVAGMRQRLGRSGRRGEPAVLRIYVQEPEITASTAPHEQLRVDLVQSVAMVRLLAQRWYEPPTEGVLHLSTLVQQVLSLIAQHGSVRADQAWNLLCKVGPFQSVGGTMFADLLRDLASSQLISQMHTGELVLDLGGERLVNHFDFYTAFSTPEEYRLAAGGRTLGTLPIVFPVYKGLHLIFGGRRWRVVSVDVEHKVIELVQAAGGRAPRFGGTGARIHDRVRKEMLRVYMDTATFPFLDPNAKGLLAEGRDAFRRMGLSKRRILKWGRASILFPWVGDRALHTLLIQLRGYDLKASAEGVAIVVNDCDPSALRTILHGMVEHGPADPWAVAAVVENLVSEKHHPFLRAELLKAEYVSAQLDPAGAHEAASGLVQTPQ